VDDATEFAGAASGVIRLRALRGTISDNDAIWVGTTQEGVANGVPGDTYVSHAGTGTEPVAGDIDKPFEGGTSGAHRVLKGFDNAANKLVMQVYHTHGTLDSQAYTGDGRNSLYKDFSSGEVVDAPTSGTGLMSVTTNAVSTTLISGFSDVTIAHVNGSVTISNVSGTFQIGEVVNYTNPTASAICLTAAITGSTTMHLGNVDSANEPTATSVFTGANSAATADCDSGMTDDDELQFNFNLQSFAALYGVVIEGGTVYNAGRSLEDIYAYLQYRCRDGETSNFYTSDGSAITLVPGQFYITANATYATTKVAPFGTLAGGVFFGAQGVWLQGMASSTV